MTLRAVSVLRAAVDFEMQPEMPIARLDPDRAGFGSGFRSRGSAGTSSNTRPRPRAESAPLRHRPRRRAAPRTRTESSSAGIPSSGPGKLFAVRNTFIRAAFSHTPARASSSAASMTDTLPMPARRSAKANALPLCPPPTIATLWSMPGRVRHPILRVGPDQPQRVAGIGVRVGRLEHAVWAGVVSRGAQPYHPFAN